MGPAPRLGIGWRPQVPRGSNRVYVTGTNAAPPNSISQRHLRTPVLLGDFDLKTLALPTGLPPRERRVRQGRRFAYSVFALHGSGQGAHDRNGAECGPKVETALFAPHWPPVNPDRKSTRLNSSHVAISYAVFCCKKKNRQS